MVNFFKKPLGIFFILIILVVIYYVILLNKKYSSDYLKEIKANWNDNKCKMKVIPIAGFIGPEGTSTTENLYNCMNDRIKNIFDTLMKPFKEIINTIMNTLKQLTDNIKDIYKVIDYIRESIKTIVTDIYSEINILMKKLEKVFINLVNVIKDILNTFMYMMKVVQDMYYSVVSLGNWFNNSIFCFDENTKIKLSNNDNCYNDKYRYKDIKDIKVGDILKGNSIVESVLKLSTNGVKMYDYFGVIVSGSHLVYESGINKWIRVEKSKFAKKIKNYNKSYIYSLITSNAKIPVFSSKLDNYNNDNNNHIIFADWYEISDDKIKTKIQDMTLSILNNKRDDRILEIEPKKTFYNKKTNNWWGFNGNTEIDMYKCNSKKRLCDVRIGDKLKDGNKVLAIVEHLTPKNVKLYRYKNKNYEEENNEIITTGSQITYDKKLKKWIKISSSNDYEEYHIDKHNFGTKKLNKLYHIITDNNKVCINGEIFSDFYQLPPNKSKIIDRFVENKINI